jgi:hypothetical protein
MKTDPILTFPYKGKELVFRLLVEPVPTFYREEGKGEVSP